MEACSPRTLGVLCSATPLTKALAPPARMQTGCSASDCRHWIGGRLLPGDPVPRRAIAEPEKLFDRAMMGCTSTRGGGVSTMPPTLCRCCTGTVSWGQRAVFCRLGRCPVGSRRCGSVGACTCPWRRKANEFATTGEAAHLRAYQEAAYPRPRVRSRMTLIRRAAGPDARRVSFGTRFSKICRSLACIFARIVYYVATD